MTVSFLSVCRISTILHFPRKRYIVKQMRSNIKNNKAEPDNIYKLIVGMSEFEHFFFMQTLSPKSGETATLQSRLFELVAYGGVIDDPSAKRHLNIQNAAQFSTLKMQLGETALDTIAFCRRKNSAKILHHFSLMKLEILLEDGNFSLARRVYKKHFTAIEEIGAYSWCLHLLRFRKRMLQAENRKKSGKDLQSIDGTIEQCIDFALTDRLLEKIAIDLQQIKAQAALRMLPKQKAEVEKIRKTIQSLAGSSQKTEHLHIRFLSVSAEVFYLLQNFESCQELVEKALNFLQDNKLLEANPEAALSLANTSFYNAFACNRVADAKKYLAIWKKHFSHFALDTIYYMRWSIIAFNTDLKIAHKSADYDKVADLLQSSNEISSTAKMILPEEESLSVMTSISISFFVLDQYQKAETLVSEIMERNRFISRDDILYFTLIFQLLIFYEQKAWYRLDTAAEAAYHFLYSRKKMRPFEKELMSFFKQMPAFRAKGTLQPAIETFLQKLEIYRNDPVQRLYFLYFNYYDWLQSKLEGIPYRQYKKNLLTIP